MKNDNAYVQELIKSIESKKSESYKKAKAYLVSQKYFDKSPDDKKEFLLSEDGLILIEGMATDKLTILFIAECLGMSQKEFHALSRENPEIYDAVDRGRAAELDSAEKALLQMATGYFKEETKTIVYRNERDSEASQEHIMKRWFAPVPSASMYYLNNKKKLEYKEKQIELEAARNTIYIKMEIIGDDEIDLS